MLVSNGLNAALASLLTLVLAVPVAAAAPAATRPTEDAAADALAASLSAEVSRLWPQCVPDESGPGMVVLVAHADDVLIRDARGRASIELGVPLRPSHVLRIASLTKQFVAAGLLRLADEGRVKLSDPLSAYLPDYPNGAAITLAQLLNHTSGVRSYTRMSDYMATALHKPVDTAGLVRVFRDQPPEFPPGTAYAYDDSGYVLIGAVIERVTGQDWDRWLDQALLAPLGLVHTRPGDTHAVIPGRARGYEVSEAGTVAPASYLDMSQPHAAGALLSTVDDLLRWNRALHGGRVLSPASYRRMITPEGPATGKDARFGYGFGIERSVIRGHDILQHSGRIPGALSWLLYAPKQAVTVAVIRNATGGDEDCVRDAARRLMAAALNDPYPVRSRATP